MRTITIRQKHLPVRVVSIDKVTEKIPAGEEAKEYYVLPRQEYMVFATLAKGAYTSRQLCRCLPISHTNSVIRNLRKRGFPVIDEWVCGDEEKHPHKIFWLKLDEEEEI